MSKRKNYRNIYKQHYGEIPKDSNGRTYEVHHIDGDRSNNDPLNLKAVSIQEHYDIHYRQGDYGACLLIAKSMSLSVIEKSNIAKLANQKRISDGSHHWLGSSVNNKRLVDGNHPFIGINEKRIDNGTHQFLDNKWQSEMVRKRVDAGTHHLLSGDIQRETNKKLLEEGKHFSQIKMLCIHCDRMIPKNNYHRWHGDNCKLRIDHSLSARNLINLGNRNE